jgi:circadian clock protein KaiB
MPRPPRKPADEPGGADAGANWVLRLYVTGMTRHSLDAIANLKSICADLLPGRHDLSVVDIRQQPGLAREDHVVAAPTLIKSGPLPVRRLIGGLADRARVVRDLDLDDPKPLLTPAL